MSRTKVVVFLDALDPRKADGFLSSIMWGHYGCAFPVVTPTNIGSILTGHLPGKHGLVCPTRYDKPAMQRPVGETILERVSKRMRVLAHGIPFTAGIKLENGISGHGGGVSDEAVALPALVFPNVGIDMGHEEPEKALQSFMDDASALFATFRQFIRNDVADAYFIGFRNLDSFAHWHQQGPWYKRLMHHIGAELAAFLKMGNDVDLFVFSDHGSMPASDVFRINLWLIERGLLRFSALWHKYMKRLEKIREQDPDAKPYKDQIGPFSPFVDIIPGPRSKFVCTDAFDSCVEVINKNVGDNEITDLCMDLLATGMFEEVHRREELYPGLTKEEYDRLPAIIPKRKPGVLVSCNLMPGLPVFGFTDHEEITNRRNGDHWPEGYYGGTGDPIQVGKLDGPHELFGLIDAFCGPGNGKPVLEQQEEDPARVAERLQALGYL